MASPTSAINRFDLSLSYAEFNAEANRRGFVGLKALPAIGVGKDHATFSKMPAAAFLAPIEDTVRAPKGGYRRDDFEWETDSYATEDHGVEEVLDDRTIRMYGSEIRAETIHRNRAINRVLMAFENAIAAAVFNTGTWTGDSLTSAATAKWDVPASAVPVDDLLAATEAVEATCGETPNTLIITKLALRKARRTEQFIGELKYSGKDDPKDLGAIEGLRTYFQLSNILVANGFKNTADKGADATLSRLWNTTMAMVCHVSNSGDIEDPTPTVGWTVMWNEENASIPGAEDTEPGLIMEEYREENVRGSILRARMDRGIKILHPEAGHLITGIL